MLLLKTRRRWIYLITALAVACCLYLVQQQQQANAEIKQVDAAELREQVMACIPDDPPGIVKEVELAALAEVESKTYYYFYAYDAEPPELPEDPDNPTAPNYQGYPGDLVISVTEGECTTEHFNPMGDPIPLASHVGQQPARLLTLDRYQRVIEQIGRDGLQARIDSWADDPGTGSTLWDEEQWALEQLNMDIPESLKEAGNG